MNYELLLFCVLFGIFLGWGLFESRKPRLRSMSFFVKKDESWFMSPEIGIPWLEYISKLDNAKPRTERTVKTTFEDGFFKESEEFPICPCGKSLHVVHEDPIPEWGISGKVWRHIDGSSASPECKIYIHKLGAEERHACGKGELWEGQTEHWVEVTCPDCLKIMEAAGTLTTEQAVKCFETPIHIGVSVQEIKPNTCPKCGPSVQLTCWEGGEIEEGEDE